MKTSQKYQKLRDFQVAKLSRNITTIQQKSRESKHPEIWNIVKSSSIRESI